MAYIERMLHTHPLQSGTQNHALATCIEAAGECLAMCNACADACLGERDVDQFKRAIRLNNDCADLCDSALRIMSRQTRSNPAMVRAAVDAMATACQLCGEECQKHAGMHEHCRLCADACRRCEHACRELMQSIRLAA